MLQIKFPQNIHKERNFIKKLPLGGDSFYIANLQKELKAPLLYIANDAYELQRLEQELVLFVPELNIASLPSYEVLPYERQSPYKDLIATRLRTLWQVQNNQLNVLLVQASTLQNLLPPQDFFNQKVFIIKIGDKIDISDLRTKLVASGYEFVNQVYEAGEFAIRGSIIDILPMGQKDAVRIDLFDDEVENIFWLDAKSQLTTGKVDKLELLPSREYNHDYDTLRVVASKLQQYFANEADGNLVKDLTNGILPAGVEFYLPLFFEKVTTLFDYLDNKWQVVYQENLQDVLNLNWQDINKRYAFYSYQYPCLKPQDLFISSDKIFSLFKNYVRFEIATTGDYLDKFALLPDLSVNALNDKPFQKLQDFAKNTNIILCTESLGRSEILRQTLESNKINARQINELSKLDKDNIVIINNNLYQGFLYKNYAFVTELELYPHGRINRRRINKNKTTSKVNSDLIVRDLAEIEVGDLVVHLNHGIGRYNGLTHQTIADFEYEMIEVIYQNDSKLFIPVHNLHLISRYSQIDGAAIELTKLGSAQWDKAKKKTEQKVNDIAAELLELYAQRELQIGNRITLPTEYQQFAESFGYEPTEDQQNSFDEIIKDLANKKPMDRLICGDVGFGKTEVAMRAAFITAMNGYQVAILAPTTLLVEQIYQNLVNRFAGFPIVIAEISRFKTKKEIIQTLELVADGRVDIVVGTHRLIQDDVKFAKLGLVIIDEEHRFGVKQKEKFKELRHNVDVLTMTATPIPRTLSMALDGLRDFSIIATAPSRRLSVNTIVIQDDKQIISEAIIREVRRGGQVFYLYNDVATIEHMQEKLQDLLPELRIAVAHGQMPESDLEQRIKDFVQQRYNLLLCSTIIETGIDIPNANTILIHRADRFGLAQLHQLRGRVGRSHHQAYCYLITPENVTKDAEKRLDAILQTSELGAGFNLAMHDLEIRGAGEILGNNQAGSVKEVGLSLYTQMLKKAIRKIKNDKTLHTSDNDVYCEVNLNTNTILPVDYCESTHERLVYYKRLANADSFEIIETIYQEIIDSYGLPPESVKNLINMHKIRLTATKFGIQKIDVNNASLNLVFIDKPPIEPLKIVLLMQELKTCKYDGKNKLIWQVKSTNIVDKLVNVDRILNGLK